MGRMFSVGYLAYVSPGCRRINAKPSNRMQCSVFSPGILATTSVALMHAGRSLSISLCSGDLSSLSGNSGSRLSSVLGWFVSNCQGHHRRVAVPALAMVAYLLRKPRLYSPTPLGNFDSSSSSNLCPQPPCLVPRMQIPLPLLG